jgi:hypothetical protein
MTHILELDYGFQPRPRYGRSTPHRRLFDLLSSRGEACATLLRRFAEFAEPLGRIPVRGEGLPGGEPFWDNGWAPPLDAVSIYCLLALRNPATYLEIGSGNTTRFARRAISDHGLRTRIVSIDPQPRAEIDALCDEVVRQPLEDVSLVAHLDLAPGDVVFVDDSHRCFQNSDVTVHFLELLPELPAGVLAGQHDIFLPYDYPAEWAERCYSEQYVLAAFLLGGHAGYEVVLPCYHASRNRELMALAGAAMDVPAEAGLGRMGTAFWMERVA